VHDQRQRCTRCEELGQWRVGARGGTTGLAARRGRDHLVHSHDGTAQGVVPLDGGKLSYLAGTGEFIVDCTFEPDVAFPKAEAVDFHRLTCGEPLDVVALVAQGGRTSTHEYYRCLWCPCSCPSSAKRAWRSVCPCTMYFGSRPWAGWIAPNPCIFSRRR
jgi:hypothetical protein